MSKFTEYLALIPKGIPNAPAIVEGIMNLVEFNCKKLPKKEREVIIQRRIICETCPFFSKNVSKSPEYKNITGKEYNTQRADKHCCFCGCPIDVRTASLSSNCGIESWNKYNPDKTLPLKWTSYAG